MLTLQENFQISDYHPKKGWEELNDVMMEIAQLQSFSECMEIVLRNFDDMRTRDGLSDKQCLEHVNQMLIMIEMNGQRLKNLETTTEKVFDAIFYNKG